MGGRKAATGQLLAGNALWGVLWAALRSSARLLDFPLSCPPRLRLLELEHNNLVFAAMIAIFLLAGALAQGGECAKAPGFRNNVNCKGKSIGVGLHQCSAWQDICDSTNGLKFRSDPWPRHWWGEVPARCPAVPSALGVCSGSPLPMHK
jgi:hypothetical protein